MNDDVHYVTDEKQVPSSLFKYMRFDNRGNFQHLFESNKLFCASAKLFNDPFDTKVFPNYHIGSEKKIMEKFIDLEKESNPNGSRKEILKSAKYHFNKNLKFLKDIEASTKRYNELIESSYGICSLSEVVDSLLMWSHYSESHKGFCVELDASKLYQLCKQYIAIEELVLLKKVIYQEEYPSINPYTKNYDLKQFMECLVTKSLVWEDEKEWRIIYVSHPNDYFQFNDDSILKGVYFGNNCSDENIQISIDILKKREIVPTFHRAELKKKEFGIEFNEIE